MGNKAKQKKNYLELLSLKDDPFKQYLETLPEMIEEHKIMRKMKGSDVILELNAQGKTAEAMVYEPNKVYDRIYTTLRKMDHLANAKKAFAKSGIPGLENYRKFVIEHAYKMKGKYPQYFLDNQKKEEPKIISLKSRLQKIYNDTIKKINGTFIKNPDIKPNQGSSKIQSSVAR